MVNKTVIWTLCHPLIH